MKKVKKTLFENAYQLFFITGLISASVAFFFKVAYPNSLFNVSVYDANFITKTSRIWFLFTGYLFLLAFIYYIISRSTLKTKRWLVISHYTFILLFLTFFAIFSSLTNQNIQKLFGGIPLITLITIYGIVFLIDVVFFILGIVFLIINLLSLNKNKLK